jgi:hypothetical protein
VSNTRLGDFHPLPKGLPRDRRYRRLSLVAGRLLVDAHMHSDEIESDGLIDASEFASLAALARIPANEVPPAIAELATAGFITSDDEVEYHLSDFRGLAHEVRQQKRAAARARQQKRRTRQPDYQMSQGNNRRD